MTVISATAGAGCAPSAVRFNHQGTLYTVVYDKVVSRQIDPIEKKPFYHFMPGSGSYSIATVLDAANVDLKFFKPESYKKISRARLEPILDAIPLYCEKRDRSEQCAWRADVEPRSRFPGYLHRLGPARGALLTIATQSVGACSSSTLQLLLSHSTAVPGRCG